MWATSEFQLGKRRLEIFDDFGGDDVGIGEVGAVFYLAAARFFGVKCLLVRPVPPSVSPFLTSDCPRSGRFALAIPRKIDAMGSKFTADSPWKSH